MNTHKLGLSRIPSNGNGNYTNPFGNFLDIRDEFLSPIEQYANKFFDDFFNSGLNGTKATAGMPKMDVVCDNTNWMIIASVPGVEPDDVKVEITKDRRVRISGKMSEDYSSPEGSKYYIKELRRSQFVREIGIPEGLEGDPEAEIKNGMLKLKWKLPEKPKEVNTSRVIEVKKVE
jgi:HSP20 family protein